MFAEELHKPMIKRLREDKVYAKFKYLAADLTEMGSLSSKNPGFKYLLCVVDAFTKMLLKHSLMELLKK